MNPLTKLRFEALAGYSRRPETVLTSEELAWYSEADEHVLGVVIRDKADDDYGSVILGRDQKGRYRAVHVTEFFVTQAEAQEKLASELVEFAGRDDAEFHQGDETGLPLDFFKPVVPDERLNPVFKLLAFKEGYSPAREIMRAMMHYYEDPDGNLSSNSRLQGSTREFGNSICLQAVSSWDGLSTVRNQFQTSVVSASATNCVSKRSPSIRLKLTANPSSPPTLRRPRNKDSSSKATWQSNSEAHSIQSSKRNTGLRKT